MAMEEWNWPEELDALHAAPEYHTLLMENEQVRVLDTRVPPGHTVPLHTHRWPCALFIKSWSDFVRCDGDGIVVADSRKVATAIDDQVLWSGPMGPHTLENVGDRDLWVVAVEQKTTAGSGGHSR
jgi:mannose-6-phosphate isomerase-like protein (cupin superfamily)